MNKVKEKYLSFLNEKIEGYKRTVEAYKAEGRKDEAELERIKANLYELFKALFITDTKQLEGKDLSRYKDINLFADFLLRFDTIPANWKVFLEQAKENNDKVRQIIEETKLEIVMDLKEKLISMVNEELEVNV
ncbi:hypothetical protein DFR55_11521 [Herbinix hemicellulosilytica]|uniref:Uncharacterized protein n=1 Tax=Herbinix hemicellulosilytica TaxID=1564487 RepID=A0A0H5SLA8_HERHM|nr:hypothetical protein [Herbinix hemicellulosilytica]RBP58045.1 hypothetical protein DFR55_11521 [Herbinix hemicellulosilytica]CRZ35531.1 hypothetical protein HHT355_2342 [Herbinix hemicellulosilytica]